MDFLVERADGFFADLVFEGEKGPIVFPEEVDFEDVGDLVGVESGGHSLVELHQDGRYNLFRRNSVPGLAHN
jgi:hypothetical protein